MQSASKRVANDDGALEWVLSLGVCVLLGIIGSQLGGATGALIGSLFIALVFLQGRLVERNYVAQIPLYLLAAKVSVPLAFAMVAGHWIVLPLAVRHGMRRVAALLIGETVAVGVGVWLASFHPILGLVGFVVSRLIASMVMAKGSGMPLDVGTISGAPAWAASIGFLLTTTLLISLGEETSTVLAQVLILSIVWLGALRAYLKASQEFSDSLIGLGNLLSHAHPYTGGHSRRVGYLARETGRKVGIPEWRLDEVVQAALLHDIGKLAVDERILEKPTKLTDEEFAVIKTHPAIGESIVNEVLEHKPMAKWIRHHHERMDGRGYPDALTMKDIPMESRLIAVLDAYDAMTGTSADGHRRLYRDPVSSEKALAELKRCAGTQFDPKVVKAFETVLTRSKRGML